MAKSTVAQRARQVAALRVEGLTNHEVAERLGLSVKYVRELASDPTGAKVRERRRRYSPPCIDCGRRTAHGDKQIVLRCDACNRRLRHNEAVARSLEGIHRFYKRYGRPPAAADFNPAHARARGDTWRAERYYRDGDYPALATVQKLFGSWSAGMRAAGFEPYQPGRYPRGPDNRHRGAHLEGERP